MNTLSNLYKKKIFHNVIGTTFCNICGKGIGILIPFFIAILYGVGTETDIFFFVYGVVLYLAEIFGRSLKSNIVTFTAKLKLEGKREVSIFITNLTVLFLVLMVFLGIFLGVFARPIFSILTHFPAGSYEELIKLFVLISPLLVLIVISNIFEGLLDSYFMFWLPAISPGIRAATCIATIFIFRHTLGIYAIVIGYVIGQALVLIILLATVIKKRFFVPVIALGNNSQLKIFLKVMLFQVISMTVIGLNPVVDKTMASWLPVGSVSILEYAQKLYLIPVAFMLSGFLVVMLSKWSEEYHHQQKRDILKKEITTVLSLVAGISIILILGLGLFSGQIIGLVFAKANFSNYVLVSVRQTFILYLIGLMFYLMGQVLVRVFLVLKNTRILLNSAILSCVCNVILNVIFMRIFGIKGIALATTVTVFISFIYLLYTFKRISREGLD